MNIYLIRHGETIWNKQNRVLGRTDIELSLEGERQAQVLGEKLSDTQLDVIFCSPLKRAIQTATAIQHKQNCDLQKLDCLIEQNFGIFEGVPRDGLAYQSAKRQYFCRYPQGESFFDVAARVYPFLNELQHTQYQNVAIVTHNGICRVIASYFEDMTEQQFVGYAQNNCEVKKYELKGF